jgi:hypothetical protein
LGFTASLAIFCAALSFARAEPEIQRSIILIGSAGCLVAAIALFVWASRGSWWWQRVGDTVDRLLSAVGEALQVLVSVFLCLLAILFVASAVSGPGASRPGSGGNTTCRHCGAVFDRNRARGFRCPVCGSLL